MHAWWCDEVLEHGYVSLLLAESCFKPVSFPTVRIMLTWFQTTASALTSKAPIAEMTECKMPTPQPVDMDALLKSAETNDCYDDDVVSIPKAMELG